MTPSHHSDSDSSEVQSDLVLVIDDNLAYGNAVCRTLERDGMRTVLATTMQQGLADLWKGADVMVIDVGLPDGDGWRVVRSARANRRHAEMPVVVISGLPGDAEFSNQANELRCKYLGKPFGGEALVANLHSAKNLVTATRERAASRPCIDRIQLASRSATRLSPQPEALAFASDPPDALPIP